MPGIKSVQRGVQWLFKFSMIKAKKEEWVFSICSLIWTVDNNAFAYFTLQLTLFYTFCYVFKVVSFLHFNSHASPLVFTQSKMYYHMKRDYCSLLQDVLANNLEIWRPPVRLSNCDVADQSIKPHVYGLVRGAWHRYSPVHTLPRARHWHIMEQFSIWHKVYQLMSELCRIHWLFWRNNNNKLFGILRKAIISEVIFANVQKSILAW
jgi:hypothetical protein